MTVCGTGGRERLVSASHAKVNGCEVGSREAAVDRVIFQWLVITGHRLLGYSGSPLEMEIGIERERESWRGRSADSWRGDRLVGLVVKASASRAEDPWFESRLRRDFSGVESYQ